jgi:hypothetical protein
MALTKTKDYLSRVRDIINNNPQEIGEVELRITRTEYLHLKEKGAKNISFKILKDINGDEHLICCVHITDINKLINL